MSKVLQTLLFVANGKADPVFIPPEAGRLREGDRVRELDVRPELRLERRAQMVEPHVVEDNLLPNFRS